MQSNTAKTGHQGRRAYARAHNPSYSCKAIRQKQDAAVNEQSPKYALLILVGYRINNDSMYSGISVNFSMM